jgi:hypothetical protein
LAALATVGGPSCTAALGLDGRQDASAALCDKLQNCYADGAPPACASRVAGRLSGNPTGDAPWLTEFSMNTCLTSCADARRCLDLSPVCGAQGDACQVREECCDFVAGQADCVDQRCCRPRGVHCDADGQCCEAGDYCEGGYCGGFICRGPGAACSLGDQCCTKSCVSRACTGEICADDGFECAADTDCCNGHCESTGLCGTSCLAEGLVCQTSGKACCTGLTCFVPKGADSGVCSTDTCLPADTSCVAGLTCCPGLGCDPVFYKCATACAPDTKPCAVDGDCCSGACSGGVCQTHCSNAYCMIGPDCCTGICVHGTCQPDCTSIDCTHDVCTEGGRLPDPNKDLPCQNPMVNDACVKAICNLDGYCCCGAWDTLCISHVPVFPAECAGACP